MRKPKGMFIQGNDIYVCDTGNNRILQITKKGTGYTLTRIIDQLQGCTPATMNTPTDVFADTNGNLYTKTDYHTNTEANKGSYQYTYTKGRCNTDSV